VLARFTAVYPQVQITIVIDRQAVLLQQLHAGKLDVIISMDFALPARAIPIGRLPLRWIGGAATRIDKTQPLPLLLFEAPCMMRQAGLEALERARRPWRTVLTSPSLAGLWAAAQAGLGVTLRTETGLPAGCKVLHTGLPALPTMHLFLLLQKQQPPAAVARLAAILEDTLKEQVNNTRKK